MYFCHRHLNMLYNNLNDKILGIFFNFVLYCKLLKICVLTICVKYWDKSNYYNIYQRYPFNIIKLLSSTSYFFINLQTIKMLRQRVSWNIILFSLGNTFVLLIYSF